MTQQRNPHQGTIRRPRLSFEDGFVMLPNTWARDMRIKPSSKGLLTWLMSHREGFETGVAHIAREHRIGKDAARGMVTDLEAHGYLRRELMRGKSGLFEGTDWQLCDPFEAALEQLDGLTIADENPRSEPMAGYPTTDEPTTDNPAPVNPTTIEDHLQETPSTNVLPAQDSNRARETPQAAVSRALRAAAEAEGRQPVKRPDYSKPASRSTMPPAPFVPRFDRSMQPPTPEDLSATDAALRLAAIALTCAANAGKPHMIPARATTCMKCGQDARTIAPEGLTA